MPGYPSFPKPPESLGRVIILQANSGASVEASIASRNVGAVSVPFNFDSEGGYFNVNWGSFASTAVGTLFIYEGTTKIASAAITSACCSRSNANSVQAGSVAVTLAAGVNQFAAGTMLKMKIKTTAKLALRGFTLTLVGMKVDRTYGYRA